MGILDDAIREHLDLKRRQGAASDDELERLEKEAFGPPTRPGDPDFPDSEGATGEHAEVAEAERPQDRAEAANGQPPEALPSSAPPIGGEPVAAEEQPPASGEQPPEEESTAGELPDQPSDELELELDLDLDADLESVSDLGEGLEEQPLIGEVEPPPTGDAPVESLDTVEHHFEGAIDDAEVVDDEPREAEPEPLAPEPAASKDAGSDEEEGEEDEDEEDVLEETPEFLRDAPEDDELWFEQGEPKDFDF